MRSALLSGAERERCYMLRANAYLHAANVENAKRDLSAILQKVVRAKARVRVRIRVGARVGVRVGDRVGFT